MNMQRHSNLNNMTSTRVVPIGDDATDNSKMVSIIIRLVIIICSIIFIFPHFYSVANSVFPTGFYETCGGR